MKKSVFYKTKLGILYNGDCRKIIPQIKENINLVYTDPVWHNSLDKLQGSSNPEMLFKQTMKCISKISDRIAIHLGIDTDPRFLKVIPKKYKFVRSIWLKYAFPHPKGRILYSGDICYLFGVPPKPYKGHKIIPGEKCATDNKGNKTGHPCSRKLEHAIYILDKFSNDNETIMDCFMGSGTTALACELMGRKWIGIEIEKKYCKLTADRIEKELKQGKLNI